MTPAIAPDAHLVIAEIMPKYSYEQGIVDYNTWIRDTLVPAQQALGRNITVVDQYTPFLTDPGDLTSIDTSLFSNGINHPTNPGYEKMAQGWFKEIEALTSFANWISDPAFRLAPTDQAFTDDPDGDRLVNGLEAWFGTHPGEFDKGLNGLATDGATTTFSHPRNEKPRSDISGIYQWSPNLVDWYAAGNGPADGPTVTVSVETTASTTTVIATASETMERLFVRAGVVQN